jgi:hypothetical protein
LNGINDLHQKFATTGGKDGLGGAQKRPDALTRQWLIARKLLLFALDFDDAGIQEYANWEHYLNLEPWPVPEEKSPGDYFTKGGNLKTWIVSGLKLKPKSQSIA